MKSIVFNQSPTFDFINLKLQYADVPKTEMINYYWFGTEKYRRYQ